MTPIRRLEDRLQATGRILRDRPSVIAQVMNEIQSRVSNVPQTQCGAQNGKIGTERDVSITDQAIATSTPANSSESSSYRLET